MTSWAAIAAAALLGSPAWAQDPADLYREGVAARYAGESEKAALLLGEVVEREPGNADAQLQLGLALLAMEKLDEAEAALQRTLAIAPDYVDARIALARVKLRQGDRSGALATLEPIDPANPEARILRSQLRGGDTGEGRLRLDLDLSYSALEGSQPDWKEGAFQIRYQASPRTALGGVAELSRRFGRTDFYGEARIDHRLGQGHSFYLSFGGTPDADFRPEWQIGAGASLRIRGGTNPTQLTMDGRQARYQAGNIQTINPGVEQYLANGRVWLTTRWINIFDENGTHESGWFVRGDVQASPIVRLFAGASDAPDTSEGVVVETFSLFGGLAFDLGKGRSLRLSLAHEDRDTGSDRLQVGLGIGTRF
ncbi:YaiO family outer membrane beta-barrel protein [Sphingosinicella rhizophila]|uniref:YaiO family outer membrane beta-barrel protein n=1 Tax=Sphingosinicella rhizophila TaxID=3050082 RepID=A0ABU3QC08_9SPHN|nr:YaiO family outer membrane beta-barrel protein [Sphingosinicella sp. GR2756]MDT9600679.1 YaiO family outer membrane beta-barrel protein [Sphingosinicella sp. GR2756]